MELIKDNSLIDSNECSPDGKQREIVIKRKNGDRETKLKDVLNYIPFGHVIKDETGMGATYLELKTERNSIIVEPIRVTASSKAKEHDALYVGSPTNLLPGKVSDMHILNYLKRKTTGFKKIMVVADSLPRLVNAIGDDIFKSFFLMIDEIDSFQTDASYRWRMETCIDIYKQFPKESRALVSATSIEFSDPELKDENQTLLRFDIPIRRSIDLIFTGDIKSLALEVISERLAKNRNEKIMIAFNSVSGCKLIADELVSQKKVAEKDIKILCSYNSREEVSNYFDELTGDKLPGRVNFFTSAYFSGFDLNESYHLISVSGNKNMYHALSEKKLKQIAGRCRLKLLSESIIYDIAPFFGAPKEYLTLDDLLNAAKNEIEALKCVTKNYSSNPHLKDQLDTIRDMIVKHTANEGYQYVRKVHFPYETHLVSYLNIDAYLENVRVRTHIYSHEISLLIILKEEGHFIRYSTHQPEMIITDKEKIKQSKAELIKPVIVLMRNEPLSVLPLLESKTLASLQKKIINAFIDYAPYIDYNQLINNLEEFGSMNDSRKLNNFLSAAYYCTLDDAVLYKRNVKFNLQLKGKYTAEQLMNAWNKIFAESGLHQTIKSEIRAVRLTKLHFKTKKYKVDNGKITLTKENPYKLKVNSKRMQSEHYNLFDDKQSSY